MGASAGFSRFLAIAASVALTGCWWWRKGPGPDDDTADPVPPLPTTCEEALTCDACLRVGTCGWCATADGARCVDGDEDGSTCDGEWNWDDTAACTGGEDHPYQRVVSCADPPPTGAPAPAPLKGYSGGSCPAIQPGVNEIQVRGATRRFILVTPANLDPGESPPVLFLWHWLGGSATGFVEIGEVQAAADADRFVAVVPDSKGDLLEKWPFLQNPFGEGRLNEELTFFDDMLTCVAETYNVNRSCVGSVGVSAGALWTAQLAARRADYLASFVSLSGGTNAPFRLGWPINTFVRNWIGAEHKLPALVLWGGGGDFCGVKFDESSRDLEHSLEADGHFVTECVHNCGHAEPPFTPAEGHSKFEFVWRFVLDHPFWLAPGESPYRLTGLPGSTTPDWCAIGAGNANERQAAECPRNACAP